MANVNNRENRLMQLQCVKENVLNILQEHRVLGQRYIRRNVPQSQADILNTLDIGIQMDQLRMRVFQIILNTVPDLVVSDEEIGLVSEMIELLVAASNEFNPEQIYRGI